MNIWDFMSDSPMLTFFLVWLILGTVFRCWNRLMRHRNIAKHGWPPAHCDADGDLKREPSK